MHSSRMRTGRSVTVCWSLLPGVVSAPGGVCSGRVSASGGCLLPGVCVCSGGCLLWVVSSPGGCLLLGVWYPSMH